jgi:hypothetical protein
MGPMKDGHIGLQRYGYALAAALLKFSSQALQQRLHIGPPDIVARVIAEEFLQRFALLAVHYIMILWTVSLRQQQL